MRSKSRSKRSIRTGVPKDGTVVAAVSGGPDSMYLLAELIRRQGRKLVIAHVNFGARGKDSDKDEALVRETARKQRIGVEIHRAELSAHSPGFEERARDIRRAFLSRLAGGSDARIVATGHTADDQVETVLMRFLEGAGISGLKGIPRETEDGTVRPILDLWKEDIVSDLRRFGIPYRVDRSNRDTRFERNWIRHTLIPLLVKRYGKSVKTRIFAMGERFRELDEYLDAEAARWIARNVKGPRSGGTAAFSRRAYSALPAALRVRILQKLCFGRAEVSPNERTLHGMDRAACVGGPSAEIAVGKGWRLVNRYGATRLVGSRAPVAPGECRLRTATARRFSPARAKEIASGGDAEVFDAAGLRLPLSVRALRPGDRIRPFGMSEEKKLKEILGDRKVPREERWGRPVVCDAEGTILWVPGVVRSAHAPVTGSTRCAKIIRYLP
jgi:tRNA(Ile)-lysidine synthase